VLRALLERPAEGTFRVLCIGAHCDDIEIGCGGTILTLLERRPAAVAVDWVVLGAADPGRRSEAERSAAAFLEQAKERRVRLEKFRDSFFPTEQARLKEVFETLKREVAPDLIFTHFRDDRHQDHRTISELTWNTWRNHLILEYEIPKYDGDLGAPNVFFPLEDAIARAKVRRILDAFQSQSARHWFTEDLLLSILRIRGMECATRGYAEAFYGRKVVLG
jgi:LmbE family N-acetylglucosaminyl deacetylase